MTDIKLKLNDVYAFSYNDKYRKKLYDPNWCFDGQFIVRESHIGTLYLEDTYYSKGSSNRFFTLEQALEKGTLTFICNLNDVALIPEEDLVYYDDKDLFNLSYQHDCYKRFYKRKDAKRSKDKMERILLQNIIGEENQILDFQDKLKRDKEKLNDLRNGNLNIQIF